MDLADFGIPSLASLLSASDLARLQGVATRARFEDGQFIHARGDAAPRMGLVVEGVVSLVRRRTDGRLITIVSWGQGQHYGLETTLAGANRTHDAVAVGTTVVDLLDRPTMETLLAERPTILRALFETTSRRLTALVEYYDDTRMQTPVVRLAKLLMKAKRSGQNPERIECSQERLAQMLGVSTVTMGQLLRKLVSDGLIQTAYRSVIIPNPPALDAWITVQQSE